MGGYVNLVIRQNGVTNKTLSYTGVIQYMYNADFYGGKEKSVKKVLGLYNNSPEQTDPEGRKLVPFSYGLIVVDFDTKRVFDHQHFCQIDLASISGFDFKSEQFLKLGQNGWLGSHLVNSWTGQEMTDCPVPEAIFKSQKDLDEWVADIEMALRKKYPYKDGRLVIGERPSPNFRIMPPGWTIRSYDWNETDLMQDDLKAAGFQITEEETEIWNAWTHEQIANNSERLAAPIE